MPFDFPSSGLVIGQTATAPTGAVYVWDGVAWRPMSVPLPPYAPLTSPVFQGDPQVPLAPYGDADQSIASTQFVTRAVAPTYDNVGRNLVQNALMAIQQRGTGPFTANGILTADRWWSIYNLDTVNMVIVSMADADRTAIGDEAARYYLGRTFTGNAGAAAYNAIYQSIEGVRRLSGKMVTVSFWANASAALKVGVSFNQQFGTGGSPSTAVTVPGVSVTTGTSWARYSVTIAIPSASGKTLGTNGDDCTQLFFWYSSGTTQAPSAGNIGVQSGTVNIWGVQLEIGTIATPLDYGGSPQQQLAQCQRFYQAIDTGAMLYNTAGVASGQTISYAVTMRAVPTAAMGNVTISNGTAVTAACTPRSAMLYWTTTATGNAQLGGYAYLSADL